MPVYNSIADLYNDMIPDLLESGFKSSPRGQECHEFIAVTNHFTDPRNCIYKNPVREYNYRYLAGELDWYLNADPDVKGILSYSKFWDNIKNPDGKTVNSNYGWLLLSKANKHGKTQWHWATRSLIKDKDTRQAIMYLGGPDYQFYENKDFVCTSNIQFFIRNDKLHMMVNQRSCDLNFGLPYDLPFFSVLQQNMMLNLRWVYPSLELGELVHVIGSLHIYNRNEDKLKDAVEAGFGEADPIHLKQPLIDMLGDRHDLKPDECPVHKLISEYTDS